MNKEDKKVLQFRSDLIKLLNQYNYNISGTNLDNGYMNIEDNFNGTNYIIKDEYSSYCVLKENNERNYENLNEQYILSCFSNNKITIDNSRMSIGIITSDKEKADDIFEDIITSNKGHIKHYANGLTNREIILDNGTRYVWIKPLDSARGFRLKGAYIDRNIDIELFDNVIRPMFVYCRKDDIKII